MNSTPPFASPVATAWRRKAYRRLTRLIKRTQIKDDQAAELLKFDEARRRLRAFQATYLGIRPIPVARIIGTVDRSKDFDRHFLPRRPELRDRYQRLEQIFLEVGYPPIVVYELGNAYFVVDGHHRVAFARQQGMATIEAEVTRLKTRFKLPPDADVGQLILAEQERLFLEKSGLAQARPAVRIELSRADDYVELLELVKVHGFHSMTERKKFVPIAEVAGSWYDQVYLPAITAIRQERLLEFFPKATEADLFLWVHRRRRALFPERGGLTFEAVVHQTKEERAEQSPKRFKNLLFRRLKSRRLFGHGEP